MDDRELEAAYAAGAAEHPALPLSEAAFSRFAAARWEGWRGEVERGPDLYLVCACLERVPGAVEQFLERYQPRLPGWLSRYGNRPELVDDLQQLLAIRCLVGADGAPPALSTYSGRGSLDGWVRVTVTREALAIVRREARNVSEEPESLARSVFASDEELAALKRLYSAPVLAAFETASARLSSAHRALLRLHYVHGVTTSALATMYGVGRATIVRRLTEARDALVESVQGELARTTGVAAADVEAVLRLVRSQVDLRLSLLLAESTRSSLADAAPR